MTLGTNSVERAKERERQLAEFRQKGFYICKSQAEYNAVLRFLRDSQDINGYEANHTYRALKITK